MELYDTFPYLENEKIIIKKMTPKDAEALSLISNNENVYKFIYPFLYKKSNKFLETAITNLGGRDFEKKKMIIAGVYEKNNPDYLVGLAEIFDYNKKNNEVTIGYKVNERYWNCGIATNIIGLLKDYLFNVVGLNVIEAFVMIENVYSSKALISNGFQKMDFMKQVNNWGGKEVVDLEVYKIENSNS